MSDVSAVGVSVVGEMCSRCSRCCRNNNEDDEEAPSSGSCSGDSLLFRKVSFSCRFFF